MNDFHYSTPARRVRLTSRSHSGGSRPILGVYSALRSDGPKHSASYFAARCDLYVFSPSSRDQLPPTEYLVSSSPSGRIYLEHGEASRARSLRLDTERGSLINEGLSEIIGPFPVPPPRDKREPNEGMVQSRCSQGNTLLTCRGHSTNPKRKRELGLHSLARRVGVCGVLPVPEPCLVLSGRLPWLVKTCESGRPASAQRP
jgi:hypothetical protein